MLPAQVFSHGRVIDLYRSPFDSHAGAEALQFSAFCCEGRLRFECRLLEEAQEIDPGERADG